MRPLLIPLLLGALACGSSSSGGGAGATADSGTGGMDSSTGGMDSGAPPQDGGAPPSDASSGSCTPDPLHTGLVAMQTGVSVDAFDCPILEWAAAYKEPDPMIFKAIIYVESRFDQPAAACPNMPCGIPSGWTAQEAGCYGLMQIVPACGGSSGRRRPDGQRTAGHDDRHDLERLGGSVFNPNVNIEIGISGIAGNRAQVEKQFPGCTVDQYTLMAVGNYNNYGSTKSCTQYNTQYDDAVVMAYKQYAAAAGYPAHAY